MHPRSRWLSLVLLAIVAAGCGPSIDAVVAHGSVTLAAPDAEVVVTTGPISFIRRTRLSAAEDGVRVRIDTDGSLSATSADDGVPGAPLSAAIIDFELDAGTRLGRRDDIAFDLLDGVARVRTGPMPGRLIIMNGRCHVSASSDDNRDGIDVRITTHGDYMSVEVTQGKVLLNATDEEERDTIFVTLEAGDAGAAKMGEAPRKGTTEWVESERD